MTIRKALPPPAKRPVRRLAATYRRLPRRPGAGRAPIPWVMAGWLAAVGLSPFWTPMGVPAVARAEVRALWLDNGTLVRLGGRPGVARLMADLREAGFNTVFVEALYRGYTLYPGPYQDPRLERWPEDPAAVVTEEARRHGLAVHAWMWALGAGIHGRPGALLEQHPQWADRDSSGSLYSATDSAMPFLDPSRPEVRAFVAAEAAAAAVRYGLDGVHLDYARYSSELAGPFGHSLHARQAFASATGIEPPDGRDPSSLTAREQEAWARWREDQVTELVRQVRSTLARHAPGAILSAAVMPEPSHARLLYLQDWLRWLADGLVDLAVPMAYTSSLANLQDVLAGIRSEFEALGPLRDPDALTRRTAVGLALFAARPEALVQQVQTVRAAGFGGVSLFAAAYLSLPTRRTLAEGPFARPAGPPDLSPSPLAALAPLPPRPRPQVPVAVLPASGPAPGSPSSVNLARSAAVEVDSAFRGYSARPLTDGVRNDVREVGRWAEAAWASAEAPEPHWIRLSWPGPVTVAQVDIYWALDRGRFYPSRRLRLEALTRPPDGWQVVWEMELGSPDGHRISRTSITTAPITATALRLVQPEGGGPQGRPDLMWVAEIEVYGESPGGAGESSTPAGGAGAS